MFVSISLEMPTLSGFTRLTSCAQVKVEMTNRLSKNNPVNFVIPFAFYMKSPSFVISYRIPSL